MGTVESIKVQRAIMEGSKEVEDCRLDLGPEGAVERGTKPIRPRTGVHIHGEKRSTDLVRHEGERN